jgi:hypothetical protein
MDKIQNHSACECVTLRALYVLLKLLVFVSYGWSIAVFELEFGFFYGELINWSLIGLSLGGASLVLVSYYIFAVYVTMFTGNWIFFLFQNWVTY